MAYYQRSYLPLTFLIPETQITAQESVSIPTADGMSIYSERHTRPRFWWLTWWIPEFLKPRGKLTESNLWSAEELATSVLNGMDRDHGRAWLLSMGVDYEKVRAMTDEELMAVSREVQTWPRKEPTHCDECGQNLPDDE